MFAHHSSTRRWLGLTVSSAMLGSGLAVASAGTAATPAAASTCPAGTTTRDIGWGAANGIVWDDAIQNDGHAITYPGIGGGPVDMTMTIVDPWNMNEDQDNPLVNLPTTDGNWDTPFYTATDGAYGPGFLTMVMTSENGEQEVTFALDFSAPVVLGEFSIGDIDYVGNNAPPSEQLHDSFQDEILLSARRGGTPVPMTGTTGTVGSPMITLDDDENGLFRVTGGPYDQNTNGNLEPGDLAGTAFIETTEPITGITFGYSNGPDDEAGDAAALAAAGGAWPAENWVAPLTATSTGVSNNHAVRVNIFTICTGSLSIGDRVWADVDGDGIQDPGEPGMAGVTVELIGPDGLVIGTTTTDGNGEYSFDHLPPWDYAIRITDVPAGYTNTHDRDSGVTAPDGDSGTITLTTTDVTDADFGLEPPLGSVSGTVFVDRDDDGLLDAPGDTGLGGVEIVLSGTDLAGNTIDLTATTAPDGTYTFPEVPAGTYTLTETQPAGYDDGIDTPGTHASLVGNDQHTITLDPGESSPGNDFAEIGTASISGTVFEDDDDDGQPDAAEAGIGGVTVTLTGTDDGGNPVTLTTTTAADGTYVFDGLRPGTYTVTEAQPAAYLDGRDDAGSEGGDDTTDDIVSSIVLGLGVDATDYDFGEIVAASISGTVVDDLGNPIPGVTLTLSGDAADTTTTGPDGTYVFDGLLPGTYTVTETQPDGYGDGGEAAGTAGGDDAADDVVSSITLTGGQQSTGNDFDETTGSIAGTVVDDLGNPIPGVTITLTGTDPNGPVTVTATTGPDGTYRFDGLLGGTYTVTEAQPEAFVDGGETAGTTGGTTGTDDVIAGIVLAPGQDSIDNDFDELRPGSITGTVVDDLGDPIPDVAITLTGTDDRGPVTITTTTGPDGTYTFDGLRPGTYTVVETQPDGYGDGGETTTAATAAVSDDRIEGIVVGAGGLIPGNDFNETTSSVAGSVVDEAGNGLPGVEITLTGTDVNGNLVTRTTTTDANGDYRFDGLVAGTYGLIEAQPDGYVDGGERAGSTGGTVANDTITDITLGAGVASIDNDFDEQRVAGQTAQGDADGNDDAPGALAFTGAGTSTLVFASSMLLGLGLVLIVVDRVRTPAVARRGD